MSEYVDFHYMPLEGKITGKQVLKQTEDAINDLGQHVYEIDIDNELIQQAIDTSNQAIDTAEAALSAVTTNRAMWFNTVAEMKATNIALGITAATRGKGVFNDGDGAFYAIRAIKGGDVDSDDTVFLDNGNVAERIKQFNFVAKDNNIVYVANVADLRESDAVTGFVYGTTGYYAPNDGGAGLYSIRTATVSDVDDGGSIIILDNGNVAELITDGIINVKKFGAYGDKTHDDTNAFKNATAFAEKTWNSTIANHPLPVIYAPTGIYKLTDTWKISYPCIVDVQGDIVYDGDHDRACVDIGGVVVAASMVGSSFMFQTIAEISAYETTNWEGGTRYYSNDAFVGLKTTNLGYCKISFGVIVNFAVGFVALANNGGWFFNEVVGKAIRNCQESFRIESSGTGWPNGNKVFDMQFHVSGTLSNNTNYNFYNIRVVHSNGSTYVLNSWSFSNVRFENASAGNFTCIYLEGCNDFAFLDYRAEVTNKARENFCVVNCTKFGTIACRNVLLDTNKVDYGAIKFINMTSNPGNALADMCRRKFDWTLISKNGVEDFRKNIIQITDSKAILKKYRCISNYANDYTAMSPIISCGDPVINVDGVDTTNLVMLIKVPKANTSYYVECFGAISIKGLNDNFQSVDLGEANNSSALLGIYGGFRMVRPYNDGRFLYGPQNNNITKYYFSVVSNSFKYIAIYVNKQTVRYKYIRIYSDDPDSTMVYNIDGINVWTSDTTPTVTTDAEIGTTIAKKGSATNEYWQLEKQADNSLAWVLH